MFLVIKREFFCKSLLISLLLLFFLSGCSNNQSSDNVVNDPDTESHNERLHDYNDNSVSIEESETESQDQNQGTDSLPETEASHDLEQMIIYTGDISIYVDNFMDTQTLIQDEITQYGGFTVESSVYRQGDNDQQTGYLIVRIPQEHFHPFMNELEANSVEVIEKSTSGNDVTEEFVDLESRLTSKEAVEERLISFLEDADNTEELLAISQDLSKVQEEIEQVMGRMNYLEDRVAYSTVTVHIEERAVNVSSLQDRESLNTLERAQSLFMDTINILVTMISRLFIFIIGLSPIILPLAIIGFGVFWFKRRKIKK